MSKRHHQNKLDPVNRVGTSISIDPEAPPSSSEIEFIPSYEDLQRRAYKIHEEKGGSDLDNWLEAEQILKKEHRAGQR